jgi:hypothetical protein
MSSNDRVDKTIAASLRNWTRTKDVNTSLTWSALLLAAVLAGVIVLWATKLGIGLNQDSATYLSVAQSLTTGHGLTQFDNTPLTQFPPGEPLLIALGHFLGVSASNWLRGINALSDAAISILTFLITLQLTRSRVLGILATVVVTITPPLLMTGVMAWSEPPFIALSLFALLMISRVAKDQWNVRLLVVTSLAIGVACSIRYIGVVLIPLEFTAICPIGGGLRDNLPKLKHAIAGSAASSIIPFAIVIRNLVADGTPTGPRVATPISFSKAMNELAVNVGQFLFPSATDPAYGVTPTDLHHELIGWIAIVCVVVGLVLLVVRRRWRGRGAPQTISRSSLRVLVTGYVALYLTFLIATEVASAADPINTRLVAPIWPLLVALSVSLLGRAFTRKKIPLALAGVVALGFVLIASLIVEQSDVSSYNSYGVGYVIRSYNISSTFIADIHSSPRPVVVSSNPYIAYLDLRQEPIYNAPEAHDIPGWASQSMSIANVEHDSCGVEWLIWFVSRASRYESLATLQAGMSLTLVSTEANAKLYRIEPEPNCQVAP